MEKNKSSKKNISAGEVKYPNKQVEQKGFIINNIECFVSAQEIKGNNATFWLSAEIPALGSMPNEF